MSYIAPTPNDFPRYAFATDTMDLSRTFQLRLLTIFDDKSADGHEGCTLQIHDIAHLVVKSRAKPMQTTPEYQRPLRDICDFGHAGQSPATFYLYAPTQHDSARLYGEALPSMTYIGYSGAVGIGFSRQGG